MSIQLIIYPQSYEGEYTSITTSPNDFVVDGIDFNTLNTSDSYDSSASNVILDSITNQPPSVINTWYRFRSTSSGTPTIPTELSGNLTLLSVPTLSLSGVYQRLSNLVVGTVYKIVLDLSTTGTGSVVIGAFNGTNMIVQNFYVANQSQITHTWTAASTNDTFVISYYNNSTDNIAISKISVTEQSITPTTTYANLQDGQVICDLYEDEDIPLTLSVDDFKNVAEKVQSYSKAFNLPATKRNNQIFDYIFEIIRTDTGLNFNPYKRTKAVLKQDGFLLFEGYLRMIDISDKSGEISYNVNLYSEVVALADVLGDKTFSELDFTELTHEYQKTNIKNSWEDSGTGITYLNSSTSGFRDANSTVKYPFVDWTHQILVGGSTGSAATVGNPEYTSLEQIFRPFINIKYLIDRIFEGVPFTYESEFFDTDDFKELYMDFNWGSNSEPIEGNGKNFLGTVTSTTAFQNLRLDAPDFSDEFGYDDTNHRFVAPQNNTGYIIDTFSYNVTVNSTDVFTFRWVHLDASGNVLNTYNYASATQSGSQINATGNNIIANLQQNETLQYQFKTDVAGSGTQTTASNIAQAEVIAFTGMTTATDNTLLQTLRGELGQWDFLKGLLTMFNLVTLPDEDNPSNIKIEPYADVFINNTASGTTSDLSLASRSIAHDWTANIDVSEMKLTPLTDLNKKTIFKFVEDEDDYAFMNYKNSAGGHLYGSKLQDEVFFTILSGQDEIVAEPFAATVVKPLMSQFPQFIVPTIYARNEDGTCEGFENSPRIMYNNGKKSTGTSYYIPPQNGLSSENQTYYLQFSHLSDIPTVAGGRDFHFGQCQLFTGVGSSLPNNLFSRYWQPYYNELYNPNTRVMTLKVNLSPSDINTFKFNDTVFIKNRTFRVNKIDYKPNDLATVEFILIP